MRPPRLPGWYTDASLPGSGSRYWNGEEWSSARKWKTGTPTVEKASKPELSPFPEADVLVLNGLRMLRRNWWQLAVIQFVSVILPGLVGGWLATSLDEPAVLSPPDGAKVSFIDSVSVLLSLAVAALWLLAAGMRASLALEFVDESGHHDGRQHGGWARLSEASRRLGHRLPGAAGWLILIVVAQQLLPPWDTVIVAGARFGYSEALPILLLVAPVLIWVRVRWVSFADLATCDRAGNPFTRSSRVSDGRWWSVFAVLAVLFIVSWLSRSLLWRTLAANVNFDGEWGINGAHFVGSEIVVTTAFFVLAIVTQAISLGVKATLYRAANAST